MTKKKRQHPDVEATIARPWCYYCERDFDDLKILINHQKAKHFKCERCGRRLNTAGGLSVHMSQVHKENLTAVDNALPNRAGLDIEIFGMEGIPEDIIQQHTQRVLTQYHQEQADRQAQNGSAALGSAAGNAPKKPKLEATSDLKKRLAEHKAAKLAAEQANGGSSGGGTPTGAGQSQIQAQNQNSFQTGSPNYAQLSQPYASPPSNGSYNPAIQPAYQPPTAYGQAGSPPQQGYGLAPTQQPQNGFGQTAQAPFHPPPSYAQPPPPSFQQQPSFSPPPFQGQSSYPAQPYSPHAPSMYPGQAGVPPRPFGAGSPMTPFQQQQYPQQPVQSPGPPANFPAPVRTGSVSLPTAPGLPQRPAFGAPPVNAFQFQQMHQGQIPAPSHNALPQQQKQDAAANGHMQPPQVLNGTSFQAQTQEAPNAASIDDLISSASKQADANAAAATQITPQVPPETLSVAPTGGKEELADDKTARKDKDKPKTTRLVYADNETSPEERMAMLSKYTFTPEQKTILV